MLIVLLRHGETAYNEQHRYQGASDVPLSERGRAKLRTADNAPDEVIVTPLCRTKQTAAILFPNAKQIVCDDLREMDFGDFEMRAYAGDLEHDPHFIVWCEDSEHNMCPNGESAPQVLARNLAAIQPVIDAGEDAVCVIHGGVTSGLMMHWFGGTRYDYLLAPGEGYQVSFNEKKPVSYSKIM